MVGNAGDSIAVAAPIVKTVGLHRQPARAKAKPRTHRHEAAEHQLESVAVGKRQDTVKAALGALATSTFDVSLGLYVVEGDDVLCGFVPIGGLLGADPQRRLDDVMSSPPGAVGPGTDQERVANLALKNSVTAVPVVDDKGRLLGVVPPMALLRVLRHEHVEDLHRLAGIRLETKHVRQALEAPPAQRARHRLPWLAVGLLGSILSAMLMARFHSLLEARIAVAFFIPGIVYIADAIGTQTEAIAVRGLSMSEQPLSRIFWGEIKTGGLLGLILAVLSLAGILLVLRDLRLALCVGVTVLFASAIAATIGIGLPALLARLGRDPAFGSGPLATIIQDVLTLLIYFAVVSIVL